jgi:multicomponent Na+:H+ antiporter subunit G
MDLLLDVASWAFLTAGSLFCITGGIGMLRLPDFYTRCHAAGITDTLGAGLILIGLGFQGGLTQVTVKLLLILIFLSLTSPTSTHALVKAAYSRGILPLGPSGVPADEGDRGGETDVVSG